MIRAGAPSPDTAAPALHPRERAALRAAARPDGGRRWGIVALAAAALAATGGLSAQAAIQRLAAATPTAATPRVAAPIAPAAADSAADALASPAQGTTGTIALPPAPASVPVPTRFDAGIVPAAPFSLARASAVDRGRALECLATAIYYEAASEPDDGQRAVAQVVLNRVRHPAFPASVCGVVFQGSERTTGCQFSFACDGAMARVPSRAGYARAARIAAAALAGQVFAPVGLATHYHTYAVTPSWNRTLVMTDAVGAHFFHRWKGAWGTAWAFHQRYRGDEPVPGPHAKLAPRIAPTGAPIVAPVIAAAAPVRPAPMTPPALIRAEHLESGAPLRADGASPDAQVLDRWKDSGKPLR